MDRIDLRVEVEPVGRVDLASNHLGESSDAIRERTVQARTIAAERFSDDSWKLNAHIPARELRKRFAPTRAALNFLHDELDHERITARGLHKVIRVAWTLADLSGRSMPDIDDVQRAYQLRAGGY
jgi:magnesium chelatase family protein